MSRDEKLYRFLSTIVFLVILESQNAKAAFIFHSFVAKPSIGSQNAKSSHSEKTCFKQDYLSLLESRQELSRKASTNRNTQNPFCHLRHPAGVCSLQIGGHQDPVRDLCFPSKIWTSKAPHGIYQVALVTGAVRGLGRAITWELGRQGHAVMASGRDPEQVRVLTEEMRFQGCQVVDWALDVTCEKSVCRLAEAFDEGLLQVPTLVFNNAGICVKGSSRDVLEETLAVNFYGVERICRWILPRMHARGKGCVINVSSGEGELVYLSSGLDQKFAKASTIPELHGVLQECRHMCDEGKELAFGDTPAYSISKAAVNALTRILDAEEQARGGMVEIRAVCPGDVDTRMCMLPDGSDVLTPEEAAKDLLWVAMNPQECPSGHFYRARSQISW